MQCKLSITSGIGLGQNHQSTELKVSGKNERNQQEKGKRKALNPNF
jgi:hypothetical protein